MIYKNVFSQKHRPAQNHKIRTINVIFKKLTQKSPAFEISPLLKAPSRGQQVRPAVGSKCRPTIYSLKTVTNPK